MPGVCTDVRLHNDVPEGLTVAVIVAATADWGIGSGSTSTPWRLPQEQQRMQDATLSTTSPNRRNAVVMEPEAFLARYADGTPPSSQLAVLLSSEPGTVAHLLSSNVCSAKSMDDAIAMLAARTDIETAFITGGAKTIDAATAHPRCSVVHITRILNTGVKCAVSMAPLQDTDWVMAREDRQTVEGQWRYKHQTYRRKKKEPVTAQTDGDDDDYADDDFEDEVEAPTSSKPQSQASASGQGASTGAQEPAAAPAPAAAAPITTKTTTTTTTTKTTKTTTTNRAASPPGSDSANAAAASNGSQRGRARTATKKSRGRSIRTRRAQKQLRVEKVYGVTAAPSRSPRSPRSRHTASRRSARSSPRSHAASPRSAPKRAADVNAHPVPPEPKLMGPHQPVTPLQRVEFVTPGPGSYNAGAAFGSQANSRRPTSSRFTFGSADRGAYERQYLNKAMQAKTRQLTTKDVDFHGGKETALSTIQAPPAFSFGKQDRGAYHKAYLNKEMAKGLQLQTTKEVDFLPMQNALTLGTFSNANKSANSPRPTFSRSPRDGYLGHQYIGKDHQKTIARVTPNMSTVELHAHGPQVESRKPTAPAFGFGTGSRARRARLAMPKNEVPKVGVPRLTGREARSKARAEVRRTTGVKSRHQSVKSASVARPPQRVARRQGTVTRTRRVVQAGGVTTSITTTRQQDVRSSAVRVSS